MRLAKPGKKTGSKSGDSRGSGWNTFFAILFFAIMVFLAWFSLLPAFESQKENGIRVVIKTGEKTSDAINRWGIENGLQYPFVLEKLFSIPQLSSKVKAGMYRFSTSSSGLHIVWKLLKGSEEQIKVTLSGILSLNQIMGRIGSKLEPDSAAIAAYLFDKTLLKNWGCTKENLIGIFMADTYYFFWDTDVETIMAKFKRQYDDFWTEENRAKAKQIGLKPLEVATLASIVDGEAMHFNEMPAIAGLYLNRLKLKMYLQADPTVKFAVSNPGIKRVYSGDLDTDHPYNTYKIKGLPPGPIAMPSKQALNAVLNAEEHEFLFMVAKVDRSGYHQFTKTYEEHKAYARAYRNSLDMRGISR
jgi:UPF0755 protein